MCANVDLPDGTKRYLTGHPGDLDPSFMPPWFDSKQASVLTTAKMTYTKTITDNLHAYMLDFISAWSSANVALSVVVYYNGVVVAGNAGSGGVLISLTSIPNLQWVLNDVIKIEVTNLDTSTRTLTLGIIGTTLDKVTPISGAPSADFVASVLKWRANSNIAFTDLSTGSPTAWLWGFGDGIGSNSQNPTHPYTAAGSFDVNLKATNVNGSDLETKLAYVTIQDAELTTAYTEVDPSGHITVTAPSRFAAAGILANETVYDQKDYGAGTITNIDMTALIRCSASVNNSSFECFGASNAAGAMATVVNGRLSVYFINSGGLKIGLRYKSATPVDVSDTYACSAGVDYYVRLVKNLADNFATLYIYTDSDFTALVDTLTVTNAEMAAKAYRYSTLISSNNFSGANAMSGYIDLCVLYRS